MALTGPTKKLEQFEKGEGAVASKVGKYAVKNLGDPAGRFFKLFVYGKGGTGKTFLIVPLLLDGQKVFVMATDVGGDGLSTVEAEMRYLGKEELLKNVVFVTLPDYAAVDTFLKSPDKVWPEIYNWNPDFIFWDGFTNWQQVDLQEEVEQDEDVMRAMDNGSPLKYWGAIKRETQRMYDRFLNLHNKKDGKLWHKAVTCLEDDKHTEEQLKGITSEVEKMRTPKQGRGPMVQGAAAKLMIPGSDLVLRTLKKVRKAKVEGGEGTKVEVSYWYETVGTDKVEAKVRGLKLDPVMPADFGKVWDMAKKYYGLVQGAVDKKLVEGNMETS